MTYKSLQSSISDLYKNNQLIIIKDPVDPYLEMAEIHRRINEKKGPAILYENVIGSPFKACSNLYGTNERCEFLFKDALVGIKHLIKLKISPLTAIKELGKTLYHFPYLLKSIPRKSYFSKPVLENNCKITDLPQIVSWPKDGGAFVTLPQVISFPPQSKKLSEANVGMYRIQLSGNEYTLNSEIGLHR